MSYSIAELWDNLVQDKTVKITYRRVFLGHPLDLWLGLTSEGYRTLIIGIGGIQVSEDKFPVFKSLSINIQELKKDTPVLMIELTSNESNDLFNSLVYDLVQESSKTENSNTALIIILQRLNRWADLFKKTKKGLDENQLQGLFGELYVLNKLLDISSDHATILSSWRGPDGDATDIGLNSVRIEIKTKLSTQHKYVQISSADQLSDQEFISTYLILNTVSRSSNGITVLEFVKDLSEKLKFSLGSADALWSKLALAGVISEDSLEGPCFEMISTTAYKVEGSFPRVVSDELSPGVFNVMYKIDLSSIEPFKTEVEGVYKHLVYKEL